MNDFTKEELQEIYDALDICYFGEYPFLRGKVRLMIDNYCEENAFVELRSKIEEMESNAIEKEIDTLTNPD